MATDGKFSGANKNSQPRTMGGSINPSRVVVQLNLEETENLAEFEKTDFSDNTKKTFVRHTIALQKGETDVRFSNEYHLNNEEIVNGVSTTADGRTVPYNPDGDVNQTFAGSLRVNEDGTTAVSIFENSSNPGTIPISVQKGKSARGGEDYMELLAEKTRLGDAITQRIAGTSNFNIDAPFVPQGQKAREEDSNVGSFFIHRSLGKHLPDNWIDPTGDQPAVVRIDTLKAMGLLTLMNSSGDLFVPDSPNDILGGLAAKAQSLVPGTARLGLRVPVSRFDGTEILESIDEGFRRPSGGDISLAGRSMLSYGSFNNPLAPFDGLSGQSARNAATLLSLTVSGLLKAYAAVFKRVFRRPMIALGRRFQGEQRNQAGNQIIKGEHTTFAQHRNTDYGSGEIIPFIVKTENDFDAALAEGFRAFFQVGGGTSGVFMTAVNNLTGAGLIGRSSGFYLTLLREIVRSTNEIVAFGIPTFVNNLGDFLRTSGVSIDNVFDRMPTDRNAPDLGIAGNVATRVLSFLEEGSRLINEAKITKVINIIASIGDISLSQGAIGGQSIIDEIDDVDPANPGEPNLAALVSKSRLSAGVLSKTKTAWGTSTTPSAYMLPQPILNGSTLYSGGRKDGARFLKNSLGKQAISPSSGGRIDQEKVKELEETLDASYVPFYFHDLRTNEIISFHAFITSLDDSLKADYAEETSYGRMGATYAHRNTTRDLGVRFMVAATNEKDFDEMWWKINRLTMMLFPQYSRGRLLEYGNQKFAQPFSQVPTSSPMVRMRVGDLITTNFSDFDLARQFGVSNAEFNPGVDGPVSREDRNAARRAERIDNITRRMMEGSWNVGERGYLESGTIVADPDTGAVYNVPLVATSRAEIISLVGDGLVTVAVSNPDGSKATFMVQGTQVMIDEEFIDTLVVDDQEVDGVQENQVREAMNNFFGNENPIIRSFNSVRGQGIPGFIASLDLEVDDKTWETQYGSRAPQMVGVSLRFLPVFEINPGLDADGFMQGALYNVGAIMNSLKGTGSPNPWEPERYNSMIASAKSKLGSSKRRGV